jgi:hypothetical protein
MPILQFEPKVLTFEKNIILPKKEKYTSEYNKIRDEERNASKKIRDQEREEARNEYHREKYAYYIGLYEKYKSKDWDFIQKQINIEKIKNEIKNEARQKEINHALARNNYFGPISKKDMEGMFDNNDKNKWQ